MRSALLLLFLGASIIVFAQPSGGTIDGLVIDSVSLQPIRGASVSIEDTRLGAVSRDSGQFVITGIPAGVHVLRVHVVGYHTHFDTVRLRAGEKRSLFIAMTIAPSTQERVIVTASKHVQAMQEVPVSTSIVERADISERSSIQLDQVLRYVPGVYMNDNQVNIRGSSGYSRGLGSRVLLLMDGVPMLAGESGELKLDVFPTMAIDHIEVVKGAGSALYGSNALGGVINIVPKQPTDTLSIYTRLYGGAWPTPSHTAWQWYQGVRTQAGIDAALTTTFKTVDLTAGASVNRSESYRQNDDFKRWQLYTRVGWRLAPTLRTWFMVNAANDNHGNWIFWRDEAHALLSSDTATLYQRIYSFKLETSAIAQYTPSTDIVSWTRLGFYRTNVDDNIVPTGPDSASKLVSRANAISLEQQITHQFAGGTTLTYGIQSTGNIIRSNFYGNRSQWDAAVYGQVEQHPITNMLTTVGLRGTVARAENLPFDGRIDPKFGWSYTVDDNLTFRASAGTGFRAPSLAERFVATRTGSLVTYPNPSLQFERSISYEVGASNTLTIASLPIAVDAALFWNDYWNLIEPDFVCALPAQIQFVNVTRARIQGFEAQASGPVIDRHVSLSLAYTYMWARSLNESAPLKYRPRHLFTAGVKTTWGPVRIGADVRFAGRPERIDDTVAVCVNPLNGLPVIPDFDKRVQTFVTDARVALDLWQIVRLPLVFTLNAYNIFQYYYVEIPANLAPIRSFTAQIEYAL